MPLVPVAEYPDRIAADLARLHLEAEGLSPILFDSGVASLGLGLLAPVRIMVPEDQAEAARILLNPAA